MKKSLALTSLALAAALAVTGCTAGGGKSGSTSASPTPQASVHITSYTQVHDLNDAIVWGLTITPQTPNALQEIDQTGKLLQQYVDASSAFTEEEKSTIDGFIATSQQAVAANDLTTAGGNLATAARSAMQVLTEK